MIYWTCNICGANLDPEEKCDCDREARRDDDKLKTEKEKNNGYGKLQSFRHSRRN